MTIYEKLYALPSLREAAVLTVIDGAAAGAHALAENGRIAFKEPGFPEEAASAAIPSRPGIIRLPSGASVFADPARSRAKLVICGGGHVAGKLLSISRFLGFETFVLEDRDVFASSAKKAGADHVLLGSYAENLAALPADQDTFFVVMTRGHAHDMECLRAILPKKPLYTGMMCSRRRAEGSVRELEEAGLGGDLLTCLHAPVGLPIGAETPEEIAVSVIAEIISIMKERGGAGVDEKLKAAILGGSRRVLAQVVFKDGSAPRGAGTKMVVFPDGSIAGTTGGGAPEAAAIKKAVSMLEDGTKTELMKFDLTGLQNGSPDETYCGGTLAVFLEQLPE